MEGEDHTPPQSAPSAPPQSQTDSRDCKHSVNARPEAGWPAYLKIIESQLNFYSILFQSSINPTFNGPESPMAWHCYGK